MITLSMIRRCISGITAVTRAASSEAPIAMRVVAAVPPAVAGKPPQPGVLPRTDAVARHPRAGTDTACP